MTQHRNLSDSELHTPKGADTATAYQVLFSAGGGTTNFRHFLEEIGSWDYSVDGASSTISFTSLSDYSYLLLETFNLKTASASRLDTRLYFNGTNQFVNSYLENGVQTASVGGAVFLGKTLASSDTNKSYSKSVICSIGESNTKTVQVSSLYGANQMFGLGVEYNDLSKSSIFINNSSSVPFTGGSIYLYGVL